MEEDLYVNANSARTFEIKVIGELDTIELHINNNIILRIDKYTTDVNGETLESRDEVWLLENPNYEGLGEVSYECNLVPNDELVNDYGLDYYIMSSFVALLWG